jgi:hypothetical protein
MSTKDEPAHFIKVVATQEHHAEAMEALTALIYDLDPRDEEEMTFNASHYRHHLHVFPEGQFVAIDTRTDTVVGLTVSMRYTPQPTLPTSWWELVGYG